MVELVSPVRLKQLLAQTQLLASVEDPYRPPDRMSNAVCMMLNLLVFVCFSFRYPARQPASHSLARLKRVLRCCYDFVPEPMVWQVRGAGTRRGAFQLFEPLRQLCDITGRGVEDAGIEGCSLTNAVADGNSFGGFEVGRSSGCHAERRQLLRADNSF